MRRAMFFLVVMVVTGATVRATVLLPGDLGDLARAARTIARGRVLVVESRWTDDRRGIETLVTLETERSLKGELDATVQFKVPGGRLGRYRNIVVGAPEFVVGQRVVVFLGATGRRGPYILGLSQGVFRLAATSAGVVVMPPAVLPVVGTAAPVIRGDPGRRPMPIREFEERVLGLSEVIR